MVDITVFEFNFGEGTEFNPRSTVGLPSALADAVDPDATDGGTDDDSDDESESDADSGSDGASTLVLLSLLAAVVVVALVGRRLLGDDLDELEDLDDLGA